jgi:hypothetical protein
MFVSDQELHLERLQERHQELQRRAEQHKLVRLAIRAARDERAASDTNTEKRSDLVNRLFSLFF